MHFKNMQPVTFLIEGPAGGTVIHGVTQPSMLSLIVPIDCSLVVWQPRSCESAEALVLLLAISRERDCCVPVQWQPSGIDT